MRGPRVIARQNRALAPIGVVIVVAAIVAAGLWPLALVVLAVGVQLTVAVSLWPDVAGRFGAITRSGARGIGAIAFRVLPALVGFVVIAVALDWGAGALWDRVTDPAPRGDGPTLAETDLPESTDPRRLSPAYDGDPWVDRYFAELETLRYGYVPYIGPRVNPVEGRYISSEDGVRTSYEPDGVDRPGTREVWFFGGSTTWGEGQRDTHTVPSEVVRAAERDGVTIRALNFGERGYTNFQEFLLLDQELLNRPVPDLVVFLDGQNEMGVRTQNEHPTPDQPTVFQLDTVEEAFERAPPMPHQVPPPEPGLWREYLDTGVASRLGRAVTGAVVPPAHAQPGPTFRPPTPAQYADAFEMYDRSTELATWVAARHGTAATFFWQPAIGDNDPVPSADLSELLPPEVHDIRDAFDAYSDDELFIDGGHSNEFGAQLLGEAMWDQIARDLR